LNRVREAIKDWCVVYVAPRIEGKSFSIDSENLHIIHKNDNSYWELLSQKGYSTAGWNPITGDFIDGGILKFSQYNYEYLFVVESSGTIQGSKFSSSLKLRKFFSVAFSILNSKDKKKLFKVMEKPYSMALLFPHSSSTDLSINMPEIGNLLPYYSEVSILTNTDINNIKKWYENESKLDPDPKNRVEKCAHFINKGMNSEDIEAYIHYFVALDALYGKIGSVEESIKKGVEKLPQEDSWSEKISWLFDLRNELVHGGSRYVKEWEKYMRYYQHFSSEPSLDIEKLAFLAISHAPLQLSNNNECQI
jgi:hypothetical protein